jgi:hypothetical protein
MPEGLSEIARQALAVDGGDFKDRRRGLESGWLLTGGITELPLSAFDIGKLKLAAHVREELERAGIAAQSIRCKSGGTHTNSNTARIIVKIHDLDFHMDLSARDVEDCEAIVAGETWHAIDAFIGRLKGAGTP